MGGSEVTLLFVWRLVSAELRESHASATISIFLVASQAQKYDATADTLEHMCAQLPPVGPMTRTDALDAGAARKEAYEEAA